MNLRKSSFIMSVAMVVTGTAMFTGCRTLEGISNGGKKGEAKNGAAEEQAFDWNASILRAIEKLPIGGGYSVGAEAKEALQAAVAWEDGKPAIRPGVAQPSFCSGATYVALLVMLAQEQRGGKLSLTPDTWRRLVVEKQVDGEGVWGRWNANGPGTARLFYELGIGRNFTEWSEARPGDFLKLFWNDFIGAQEKGHSVIFIDRGIVDGEDTVAFWSSNESEGYGVKQVPFAKVKRAIFSRLQHPENFSKVSSLSEKDEFLFSLLQKSVSPEAAAKACGLKKL